MSALRFGRSISLLVESTAVCRLCSHETKNSLTPYSHREALHSLRIHETQQLVHGYWMASLSRYFGNGWSLQVSIWPLKLKSAFVSNDFTVATIGATRWDGQLKSRPTLGTTAKGLRKTQTCNSAMSKESSRRRAG